MVVDMRNTNHVCGREDVRLAGQAPRIPNLHPVHPPLYDHPVPDRLRGVPCDGWDGPGAGDAAAPTPHNATRARPGAAGGAGMWGYAGAMRGALRSRASWTRAAPVRWIRWCWG